jgi:FkbH-like protein
MKTLELSSDFNLSLLEKILKKKNNFDIKKFNFSNIFYQLKNSLNSDINIVLSTAEGLFSSYNQFKDSGATNYKVLDKEINYFSKLIIEKAKKNNLLIVCSFVDYNYKIGHNVNNYKNMNSKSYILNYINNKITKNFSKFNNIHIFDMTEIFFNYKKNAVDFDFYLLSKSYFDLKFYKFLGKILNEFIISYKKKIKLILLDLDDTLWGGTVAECGWKRLNLGGNNIEGEAFIQFQKNLLKFKKLGIPLGIVSKNNYKTAIEAINKHPEMILRKDDFIITKINWSEKANNILEIANELNLTTDSFVFFDNSEFERKNVKNRIPNINIPDLSGGPLTHTKMLEKLEIIFDKNVTSEDKKRSEMYIDNQKRDTVLKKLIEKDDWIKELDIKIIYEKFKKENEDRIIQLFNKTNQMNLTTNRYNNQKFKNLINKKNIQFYSVKVFDKFGYYGLTGLLTIINKKNISFVEDFVMSCRVTGRGVEEEIVNFLKKKYQKKNNKIILNLKKTIKNDLMQNFLENRKLFNRVKKGEYVII